jgi:sugar phosphate isomerase/epimerase
MIVGYHAAGLLFHDPVVAIGELARIGYQSVAIRPHGASLNPSCPYFGQQVLRLGDAIAKASVRCVLDLASPFLPDPFAPRGPSLVSTDPKVAALARDWVASWIAVSGELGVELISFSSGSWEDSGSEPVEAMLERLSAQLRELSDQATRQGVRLALHPRAEDAIATVAQFERLGQWLEVDANLVLAADVGEMLAGGELPVADRLARNLDELACIYLCDRRAGVSGDQRIGHGDVALGRILQSLRRQDYQGHAIVRVEGHSELGFTPASEAIQILAVR